MSKGNQIFVTVHSGKSWPPRVIEIRVGYEEKFGTVRSRLITDLECSSEDLLLLLRKKEIAASEDHLTISQLEMHTGFSLTAWDMRSSTISEIWPPMKTDEKGRRFVV